MTNKQIEVALKDLYDLAPEDIIQNREVTAKDVYKQMSSEERSDIREHIYLQNHEQ